MTPIQPILIAVIVFIGLLYLRTLRSRLLGRLVAGALTVGGITVVLYPELSNWFARRLGVGRGADLIFDLLSLAALYFFLALHLRIRSLERKLTEIGRAVALARAHPANGEE